MTIDRDDIIGEHHVAGSAGTTCSHAEVLIDDATRVITIRFSEADVTVLADGTVYQRPLSKKLRVKLAPPETTFAMMNRRTGLPTGGTRTYDTLAQMIMSLYVHAVNARTAGDSSVVE